MTDGPTTTAAPEPEIGSPAWIERRRRLWDQRTRDLLHMLVKYEDEHPADAICLAPALDAARRTRDLLHMLVKYEDEHPADAICLAPALDAARRTVPHA